MSSPAETSNTKSLLLHKFPKELIRELKVAAATREMSLRDLCVEVLTSAMAPVAIRFDGPIDLSETALRPGKLEYVPREKVARGKKGAGHASSADGSKAELGGLGGPGSDGGGSGSGSGAGVRDGRVEGVVAAGGAGGVKDMGAGVPVRAGRDTRVPSDGASFSRVVEAVPAKNNSGVLGSDAPGTSGVDLRGDDDAEVEEMQEVRTEVAPDPAGQADMPRVPGEEGLTPLYRDSVLYPDTSKMPQPRPEIQKPDMAALRAIAAGNFTRAPQVEEESAGVEPCGHKEWVDGERYRCRLTAGHKGKCQPGEKVES